MILQSSVAGICLNPPCVNSVIHANSQVNSMRMVNGWGNLQEQYCTITIET